MKDLFIEIFTEEIPSSFLVNSIESLKSIVEKCLHAKGVDYKQTEIFSTPRRLAVLIHDVEEKSKDELLEQKGPLYEAAYKDGKVTPAGNGFLKSNGIDESVIATLNHDEKTNALYLKNIGGKDYLYIKKEKYGTDTKEIIKENFLDIINAVKFPKKMRWGDGDFAFVRPVHNINLMFGSDVIDVNVNGIHSNNQVFGHRLLSPEGEVLASGKDYEKTLEKKYVVVSREKRYADVITQLEKIEKETGFTAVEKNKVANIVVDLVEKPYLLKADFDKKFLEVPDEVLISEMIEHQKYFPMQDKDGRLTTTFIITANQPETKHIIGGNIRVLTARLSDGRFLYQEDIKNGLDKMNERLPAFLFRKELGSMKEKVSRIEKNALVLLSKLRLESEKEKILAAVKYMKADLLSNMVYQFPDLQGIMGGYFAKHQGLSEDVCIAIREQYKPLSAKDANPSNTVGKIIAMTDKLDNIISGFYVGDIPTGSQDPNALRRQALGIIHIILEAKYTLNLKDTIDEMIKNFPQEARNNKNDITSDIVEFIKSRFENDLSDNYSYDATRGVLAVGLTDINNSYEKIKAVDAFRKNKSELFANLLTAFKRISKIIKSFKDTNIKKELLIENAEKILYEIYTKKENAVKECINGKDVKDSALYEKIFTDLSEIYEPIDIFFKDVLVMDKNEYIKNNRIALLASIDNLFKTMLDFSALVK